MHQPLTKERRGRRIQVSLPAASKEPPLSEVERAGAQRDQCELGSWRLMQRELGLGKERGHQQC